MWCWTDELLPILLEMLNDSGSQEKRGVALWVLGKLVEGLGYVIQPYEKYPTLLDTLLGFLKTEQQPLVRLERFLKYIHVFMGIISILIFSIGEKQYEYLVFLAPWILISTK